MKRFQHIRILSWGYIAGLHLLIAILFWQTDAIELIKRRLSDWGPVEMSKVWQHFVAVQRQIDAQLPPGAVVLIGDSIVEGFSVTRLGRPAATFGIGGDTTVGVLGRLDRYRSLATASAIVLLVGSNDMLYRPETEVGPNLRKILERLSGLPGQVLAVGLLPVDETAQRGRSNAVMTRINVELRQACAAQRNCRYLDAWPVLAPSGQLAAAFHPGDGIHLNAAGYERLAVLLTAALPPP